MRLGVEKGSIANHELTNIRGVTGRIGRNLGIVLGSSAFAALLGLLTSMTNMRAIGAEGVGALVLMQAQAFMLSGLLSLGTSQPVIKTARFAMEAQQTYGVRRVFLMGFATEWFGGAVSAVVFGILLLGFQEWFPNDTMNFWVFLAWVLVILTHPTQTAQSVFRLLGKFHFVRLPVMVSAASLLIISLLLALFDAEVSAYLVSFAVVFVVVSVGTTLGAMLLLRRQRLLPTLRAMDRPTREELREFLSFSIYVYLSRIPRILQSRVDVVLISALYTPAVTGVYGVLKQLGSALYKLQGMITLVVFPEQVALAARNQYRESLKLFLFASVGGLVAGSAVFGVMLFFGDRVLHWLFGSSLADASLPFLILLFAYTLSLSASTYLGSIQALSHPARVILVVYAALTLYAICFFPLISEYGIVGAAWCQVVYHGSIWAFGGGMILRLLLPRATQQKAENLGDQVL